MLLSAIRRATTASISALLRSGGGSDVAGVQPHVSALDTLTGQNADRSQVLRQADCQDDAGEFLGALDAEHLDCGLRYGVHFGGPADEADRHG